MINMVLALIILLIAGGAGAYIYKEKKKGKHCIGCPYCGGCNGQSCGSQDTPEKK